MIIRHGKRSCELGPLGAIHLDYRDHDTEDRGNRSRLGTVGARHRVRPNPGILNLYSALQAVSIVAFFWTFAAMLVAVHECLDYDSIWRPFFVILLAAIPVFIFNFFVLDAIIFALTGG